MAKETEPKTYRISPEVDAEIRRRAEEHGGVDRALRAALLDDSVVKEPIKLVAGESRDITPPEWKTDAEKKSVTVNLASPKAPLLKPKDRK